VSEKLQKLLIYLTIVRIITGVSTASLVVWPFIGWYFMPLGQSVGLLFVAGAMQYVTCKRMLNYLKRKSWLSLIAQCNGDEERARRHWVYSVLY